MRKCPLAVTVPADVRQALRIGPGDRIAFVTNERGDIIVVKPRVAALIEAQRSFVRAAEQAGAALGDRR